MHGRLLGAGRDDDEVAIPPLEPLEHRKQLVALRASLRAADALLGLAPGQLLHGDGLLGLLLRLHPALEDSFEQRLRTVACVERGIEIDGACDRDQRVAPLLRGGVEQPLGTVEASGGHARDRRCVFLREIGRARSHLRAHCALGQAPERHELAAGADRLRQRAEIAREQQDHRVRRRLLEILQERVGGVLVHRVGVEDEIHAARRLVGTHVQVAAQRADVVDADLVSDRLEHVQIGMRAPLDACVLAEQLGREEHREGALADAGRPVQQVRVRRPLGERSRQQALRLVLLRDGGERHRSNGSTAPQTSAATSPTSRGSPSSPSVGTTRQPFRPASSRYSSRVAPLCPASASWMSASSVV